MRSAVVAPLPASEPRRQSGPSEALGRVTEAWHAGAQLGTPEKSTHGSTPGELKRPWRCSASTSARASSGSRLNRLSDGTWQVVCTCSARRVLRNALDSRAWQLLHTLCLVIAVWAVDACVLLHIPNQGAQLHVLDAVLCVVLAFFALDWLARASLDNTNSGDPAFLLSSAAVTDAVSAASLLADLSWLRPHVTARLLRICRAARLIRFSRLAKHTHWALTALAARWTPHSTHQDAAPSAIAAALCEEVAYKLAVLLITGYMAATPLLTYVENNAAATTWHAVFATELGASQPVTPSTSANFEALATACIGAFAGSTSTPLRVDIPGANFSWVNPDASLSGGTSLTALPRRTDDWLTLASDGVALRLDVRAATAYVARANVLIGCALAGTLLLVSASLAYSTHVHVVVPLRRIFELIQASASAALGALFTEALAASLQGTGGGGGGGGDDDDTGTAMQGVETAVMRLATLVGHMSGISTAHPHVEDADVDDHTRVWLTTQAAIADQAQPIPMGLASPSPVLVPPSRPREPSVAVPGSVKAHPKRLAYNGSGDATATLALLPPLPPSPRSNSQGEGGGDVPAVGYEMPAGQPPEVALAVLDSWEFDSLALSTGQLFAAVVAMFDSAGVFAARLVTPGRLWAFLGVLEAGYSKGTAYHTFAHAVDVCHTMYRLLTLTDKRCRVAVVDKFAMLVAALAHDVGHEGVNNTFLVATRHPVTLTHGDTSPLERFHLASLYELCARHPEADIFCGCDDATWRAVRRTISNCVLHTDMVHHGPLLSRAELCLQLHLETGGGEGGAQADGASSSAAPDVAPGDAVLFASPDNRLLLFSILLHAADISNPAKPWAIASKWANLVTTEFFAQGDAERDRGLPVSPLNDRHAAAAGSFAAGQINFVEFVVAPLFAFLAKACPETTPLLVQLSLNREALNAAYEAEANQAAASGGDTSGWDVQRMANRLRAFRDKYEPLMGPRSGAKPGHASFNSAGGHSLARSSSPGGSTAGSTVGSMTPVEQVAARLRAAINGMQSQSSQQGRHQRGKPPLSPSRRGSGISSRSHSISSSLDDGESNVTQWLRRGSGVVRHVYSEVPLLWAPAPNASSPGGAADGAATPDMEVDMRLKARHMHATAAELPEECAAERGIRPSSFTEDVGGSASPLRRQGSSRRGSFPPSEPFMV